MSADTDDGPLIGASQSGRRVALIVLAIGIVLLLVVPLLLALG